MTDRIVPMVLVEDQPDIRLLVAMTLQREPIALHEADGPDVGWALIERLAPPLVLIDVSLVEDRDGLDLVRRVRADARCAGMRLVVMSAGSRPCDRAAALDAGADAFLAKPFAPRALVELVRSMLGMQAAPAAAEPVQPR